MAFCIYEFTGPTTDIAVVHKNWLLNDKCYWPPFWKNNSLLCQAIKKGTQPDYETWSLYDGHVVGNRFYETYELGRKHLEQAQHGSDFSTDDINNRRRRVATVEYNFSRKVDSDSESELQHGATPRRVNKKVPKRKLYSINREVSSLPDPPPPPSLPPTTTRYSETKAETFLPPVQSVQTEKTPRLVYVDPNSINTQQESDYQMQPRAFPAPSQHHPRFSQLPVLGSGCYDQQAYGIDQRFLTPVASRCVEGETNPSGNIVAPNSFGGKVPVVSNSSVGSHPEVEFNAPGQIFNPPSFRQPYVPETNAFFSPTVPLNVDNEAIRSLQRGQQIIAAKLDIIVDMMRTILGAKCAADTNVPTTAISLPLQTIDDFYRLERDVRTTRKIKNDLISIFSTKGGNNHNQIAYRIVDALMTDDLMTAFTFAGQTGKRSFKNTAFVNCICEAVRRCPKGAIATDKDVEKAIEYWLKKSSTRIKRRSNKQQRTIGGQSSNHSEVNEDDELEDDVEFIPATP